MLIRLVGSSIDSSDDSSKQPSGDRIEINL